LQSQLSLNYVGCELVDLCDVIALPGLDPGIDRAIQYSAGEALASDGWSLDAPLDAGHDTRGGGRFVPIAVDKTASGWPSSIDL
jgi:hypothetical protein